MEEMLFEIFFLLFYFKLWPPFCAVEQNNVSSFGSGPPKKQSCQGFIRKFSVFGGEIFYIFECACFRNEFLNLMGYVISCFSYKWYVFVSQKLQFVYTNPSSSLLTPSVLIQMTTN